MAHIPADAKWYIAEIIQEFRFEDGEESLVHVNLVLVRADSPEEAYNKAIQLGKEHEFSYEVGSGKDASTIFRGLRELNVIHDELEHGAEILFEDKGMLDETAIKRLIRPKEQLSIFRPMSPLGE